MKKKKEPSNFIMEATILSVNSLWRPLKLQVYLEFTFPLQSQYLHQSQSLQPKAGTYPWSKNQDFLHSFMGNYPQVLDSHLISIQFSLLERYLDGHKIPVTLNFSCQGAIPSLEYALPMIPHI